MQNEKDNNLDIFRFDKKDVERYMLRELGLKEKFTKCFEYIFNNLAPLNKQNFIPKDLSTLKWYEGKSYYWVAISSENVSIILRRYGNHFTVFHKNVPTTGEDWEKEWNTKYGCFEFRTDLDNMSAKLHDSFIEDRFKDMNLYINPIINIIKAGKVHAVWNPLSLKHGKVKERPKRIKVKCIWDGGDYDISSVDMFIFACDELFQRYLEIFSETEMLEKIKTMKVGDKFGSDKYPYEVVEVKTKVKDNYYHAVGLCYKETDFTGKTKEKWDDVYSLTRWRYNEVFGIKEQEEQD